MADLSITAANVVAASTSTTKAGTAGATITAGQAVYKLAADGLIHPADANDSAKYKAVGIALNGASVNQPIDYVEKSNDLDIGATLTIGTVYVLSATAGGVAPAADLTTGDYAVILGVATAADSMRVNIGADTRADAVIA